MASNERMSGAYAAMMPSRSLARAALAQSSIRPQTWASSSVLVICSAISSSVVLMPMTPACRPGVRWRVPPQGELGVLRERIGDLVPGRLRADEDMEHRANPRVVDQGSHPDVKEPAGAHEGEQRRAA